MSVVCEATRSQQVRGNSGSAQAFFNKRTPAAADRDQRVQVKNNALILLEDVDIVFNDLGKFSWFRTIIFGSGMNSTV